jgi:hypothetical protein
MNEPEISVAKYRVGKGRNSIYIEDRGDDRWAITRDSSACLNTDGQWECEPMPSSRTDDFLSRCRYSLDEAKRRAIRAFAAA